MNTASKRPGVRTQSGIILVTVILIIFLIAVVLISMVTVVRQDRNRAHSFLEAHRSEMLIDMATQEVMAKLMDGGEIEYRDGVRTASMTASPGMLELRQYGHPPNRGYQRGKAAFSDPHSFCRNPFAPEYEAYRKGNWQPANPRMINLFSKRWYAPGIRYRTRFNDSVSDGNPDYNPARVFNINTPDNPFRPGELYLTGTPEESMAVKDIATTAEENQRVIPKKYNAYDFQYKEGELATDRPILVQWLPVYKRADQGPVYEDENGREVKNEIVGRYAYWVDVENTKVNIRNSDRLFELSDIAALTGLSDSENPRISNGAVFGQDPRPNLATADGGVVLRGELEGKLMHPREDMTLDGTLNHAGNNDAAVAYHGYWFDWRPDGTRPYCSDTSMVDWRTFTGLRPWSGGEGRRTTIEGLIHDAALNTDKHFNTVAEVYSLLDPKVEQARPERGLAAMTAMRRTYGNAVTLYGWEGERDPLGRPKLDIVTLQREGMAGPTAIEFLERLVDPRYYNAYYPAAYPSGGRPISFLQSLNGQCGDNEERNDLNGLAAVLQMLANIVEYAKPHDAPPFIDETPEGRGIVPAKSMPYVTEVATRARNGMWQLYEQDSPNTEYNQLVDTVLNGNPAQIDSMSNIVHYVTGDGRPLPFFLTNVVIDLSFALANPNPFAREAASGTRLNSYFDGDLNIDYSWAGNFDPLRYPDTQNGRHQVSDEIHGLYAARPRNTAAVRVTGEAAYFNLGMIPGATVEDPALSTCFRLHGWDIRREGDLFHKVPIRHLAQQGPVRDWWEMAQPGFNAGIPHDANALCAFAGPFAYRSQPPREILRKYRDLNHVAVGWFSARTLSEYIRDESTPALTQRPEGLVDFLFMDPATWTHLTSTNSLLSTNLSERAKGFTALTNFVYTATTTPALVERVASIDPSLGHRTGNPDATHPMDLCKLRRGGDISGHFYGSNGHPWRHYYYWKPEAAEDIWVTINVYGPRPPDKKVTVIRLVPVGNTIVEVEDTVFVRQDPEIIRTEQVRRPGRSALLDNSLTADFGISSNQRVHQQELGSLVASLRMREYLRAPGAVGKQWYYPSIETTKASTDPGKSNTQDYIQKRVMGNNQSFFASAPKGDYMVSIGELGFVHSGLLMRPIDLTKNAFSWQGGTLEQPPNSLRNVLGSPGNGPPMHMLLDLFTPGAFRNNRDQAFYTAEQWRDQPDGAYQPNSPSNPRRGTWNINSQVAYDGYLAIREGGHASTKQGATPLHPYWAPVASSDRRIAPDKTSATALDPYMSPFPRFRRGWESWIAIIGGDYTPYRSRGFGAWRRPIWDGGSYPDSSFEVMGMPQFTWSAGKGASGSSDHYNVNYVNFDPDYGGLARLFAKGRLDGSHADVKDRMAADYLFPFDQNTMELYRSARYDVFPLRHHISEVIENASGKINGITTALNPFSTSMLQKNYDWYTGHCGAFRISGIYANAPVALVANQISTSANVFTIHIVAQSIRDNGAEREDKGSPAENIHTGIGYMDESDEVISEYWAKTTVARLSDPQEIDPETKGPENTYQVLYHRVLENSR